MWLHPEKADILSCVPSKRPLMDKINQLEFAAKTAFWYKRLIKTSQQDMQKHLIFSMTGMEDSDATSTHLQYEATPF